MGALSADTDTVLVHEAQPRVVAIVLVDTIRALRAARSQRDAWRLIALCALDRMTEQARQLAVLDPRSPIHRRALAEIRRAVARQLDADTASETPV
jgi:hypothetical protein